MVLSAKASLGVLQRVATERMKLVKIQNSSRIEDDVQEFGKKYFGAGQTRTVFLLIRYYLLVLPVYLLDESVQKRIRSRFARRAQSTDDHQQHIGQLSYRSIQVDRVHLHPVLPLQEDYTTALKLKTKAQFWWKKIGIRF